MYWYHVACVRPLCVAIDSIMRFYTSTCGLVAAFAVPALVKADCSDSAISELVDANFFETLVSCIYDGEIGPQTCVTDIVAGMSTELTAATDCRGHLDDFASDLDGNEDLTHDCQQIFTYDCLDSLVTELATFETSAGRSLLYKQCTSALVRKYSVEDPFDYLIRRAFGGTPDANDLLDEITDRPADDTSLTSDEILCRLAYKRFYDDAVAYAEDVAADATLIEACVDDTSSSDCSESTEIISLLDNWANATGFAGMDVIGPYCSADEILAVDSNIAIPVFKYVVFCMHHPTDAVCLSNSNTGFWSQIEDFVNEDCNFCYLEFEEDVSEMAADPDSCEEDSLADDCLAYYQDALTAFEDCAGYTLSTDDETTTTTSAPTDTSTDTTVGTTTTTEVTTTAAAETTTKASTAISSYVTSAILIMIALAL